MRSLQPFSAAQCVVQCNIVIESWGAVLLGNCTRSVAACVLIKVSCLYSAGRVFLLLDSEGKSLRDYQTRIISYFLFTGLTLSLFFEIFIASSFWINEASLQSSHVDVWDIDSLTKWYVWTERGRSSDSIITPIRLPSVPQRAIRACSRRKCRRDKFLPVTFSMKSQQNFPAHKNST